MLTFDQLTRFLMARDQRPVHDAIAHLLSINDHDRKRLARSIKEHEPCEAYAYECTCADCRLHDHVRRILA